MQHLACWPHEGLSQFCPEIITKSVYLASLSVFKAAINCGTSPKIIYYSSMARFGQGNYKPPFSEDMPRMPEDIYAIAKCAAERALEIFSSIHKFSYNIATPHNVYGPGLVIDDPYRNVLGIFVNSILRGKPIYVYGDGNAQRALSYIDDVVEPMARLGLDENINGEIINLGSAKVHTINELAQIVIEEFGLQMKPIYLPERPCEVKNAYCTIDKSVKLLGFKDKTPVRIGIRKLIEWAKVYGAKEPRYLDKLEIEAHAPKVWIEKMLK